MPIYSLIQKLDDALAALERGLAIALAAAITLVMMAQVVLRYFFNAPIFWAEEISVQFLVFMTLIGLALLVRSGQLVCIDFLPRALSPKAKLVLDALLGLLLLALFMFVAWLGFNWIVRPEVQLELSATTQLPRWYTYVVLPVVMVACGWHQAAAILRSLHGLAGAHA